MQEKVKALAEQYFKEVVEIRRHLHAHPELSFEEFETSKFICNFLDKNNIPYRAGYVKTGIVAHIKGKNPDSKVVALRADMDALPILETNDVPYKSKNKGIMHACGHDVHTSSMMGAAKILHQLRNEFDGTIKIVFQPGEELLPGGASLMLKEGALKKPDAELIVGQHVYPQLEAGLVGFRKGMYMASADEIYVTVKGKGGHAALPQRCIDPILIASHIVIALQQIVSRHANPIIPSVLSFGRIEGLGVTNIIPEEVKLEGTFRTFDEDWRAEAKMKMKKMAESIADGMGGYCDFDIQDGYPYLVNDEGVTDVCWNAANEYLGEEQVIPLDLRMTSEDFAYYSQEMPSCFYRLGIANTALGINKGLHTGNFDIDEKALKVGSGLMAWLAIKLLQEDTHINAQVKK
jgi:amidohydrolase